MNTSKKIQAQETKKMADPQTNPSKLVYAEDEVKHVPLDQIFVDSDWNSRSRANTLAEYSEFGEERQGITGLTKSILIDGQDDPVVVRSTKGDNGHGSFYKKTDKPFALVTGFRRYEAIRRLNDPKITTKDTPGELPEEIGMMLKIRKEDKKPIVPNTADGTIRVVVRQLDEMDARMLNVRENTNRDDITAPDLMMAVKDLQTRYPADKRDRCASAIADSLGKSQGHISTLLSIAKMNPKILHHWRNGGEFAVPGEDPIPSKLRANVREVYAIYKAFEKEPEKQLEEYIRILKAKDSTREDGNSWVVATKKKVAAIGALLGKLEKEGFLKVGKNVEWKDYIQHMAKTEKKDVKLNPRQKVSIGKAGADAYVAALTAADEEEEEKEEGKKAAVA